VQPILKVDENCVALESVTGAALLVDAECYYGAFCEAATAARNTICITGWQFDTQAEIHRAKNTDAPSTFIEFLNYLCERTPELQIFITAWNYSIVYALEREWFQNVRFALKAHERIHFRFLEHPTPGASHHEKIVVIDQSIGFVGGMDICDERWDTRKHDPAEPTRVNTNGTAYGPFHDVQVAVTGPVVLTLHEQFWKSWDLATDGRERPPAAAQVVHAEAPVARDLAHVFESLPLRSPKVALSRTRPAASGTQDCFEIEALYRAAIDAAERSIYLENQYFTSQAIVQSMIRRMVDKNRPKLDIFMLLPDGGHSKKEALVIGTRQNLMLWLVKEFARVHGHQVRVLKSCTKADDRLVATFIHSKVMVVDDRFITVGTANLMNRSMRLDHELNLSFDAALLEGKQQRELIRDIRAVRCSLMAEHAGLERELCFAELGELTSVIDGLCEDPRSKLFTQAIPEPTVDDPVRAAVFDPSGPIDWDTLSTAVEASFAEPDFPAQSAARKVGQRLGVVDVTEGQAVGRPDAASS
jgi:phospholipase D1/2